MELNARTTLLVQISAAAATNSLAALRTAVTDAKAQGVPVEEIQKTVSLATEIHEQSASHARHLLSQLFKEPIRKSENNSSHHDHGPGCNCGSHHHHS